MEEKEKVSFCEIVGKMVLKAIALCIAFSAIKLLISKVFHKKVEISVNVEDEKCCCGGKEKDEMSESEEEGAEAEEETSEEQ